MRCFQWEVCCPPYLFLYMILGSSLCSVLFTVLVRSRLITRCCGVRVFVLLVLGWLLLTSWIRGFTGSVKFGNFSAMTSLTVVFCSLSHLSPSVPVSVLVLSLTCFDAWGRLLPWSHSSLTLCSLFYCLYFLLGGFYCCAIKVTNLFFCSL